jgi:glutamate synthase domain-containing protein 2
MDSFLLPVFYISLDFLASLFVMVIGLLVLAVVVLFVLDVSQTHDAIRRNYPVIGRFRSLFSNLGEFFRQYFFAMDREEMPFNRAERDWVEKSSEGVDNTVAFGSTRSLTAIGTPIYVNCPYPPMSEETSMAPQVVIGPGCRTPYAAQSIINVSAMSFGALSVPAVRALSRGAKLAGCWLNTGEGGLAPYHLEGGCDVVFQIGTAKYGVRDENGNLSDERLAEIAGHDQVRMFELKLAQGAKPGKGGILPASKVTAEIAGIRGIPPGQDSISPNRHVEVNSNSELLDLIGHIREVTGKPAGFKTVFGGFDWFEDLCSEINRRGTASAPDFVTVDSGDGGTGAAPMPLMDNVGLTVREALPAVVDILTRYGLRDRVKVICSGKLITPAEVAWAYCAGTDFVVSARGFMFALGCIQSLKCNKNTCPTGITTHDKRLQRGLDPADKAVRVKNFVGKIRYGVGLIAHSCGVAHPRALARHHVRIVQDTGRSVGLDELWPPQAVPGSKSKGTARGRKGRT